MFLRCIRYRLRSDWLRLLLGLVFGVILLSWTGTINIISDELRSFSGYVSGRPRVICLLSWSKASMTYPPR